MGVFSRQQATAERLIKKNGRSAVLRKFSNTTDPDKPWVQTPNTITDVKVTIVTLPFVTTILNLTQEWSRKNGDVMTGIVQALMSSKTVVPTLNDVVIYDNKTYNILNIEILSPNGEPLLYTMALKE